LKSAARLVTGTVRAGLCPSGSSEGDAQLLRGAFNIKTVSDLGMNKYFRAAQLLTQLAEVGAEQETLARPASRGPSTASRRPRGSAPGPVNQQVSPRWTAEGPPERSFPHSSHLIGPAAARPGWEAMRGSEEAKRQVRGDVEDRQGTAEDIRRTTQSASHSERHRTTAGPHHPRVLGLL